MHKFPQRPEIVNRIGNPFMADAKKDAKYIKRSQSEKNNGIS